MKTLWKYRKKGGIFQSRLAWLAVVALGFKGGIVLLAGWLFVMTVMTWNVAYAGTQIWDFGKPDSVKDWKTVTGTWEVKDGAYQLKGDTFGMHSLVGDSGWINYTVEAKIRIDRGNLAGPIVRAQSDLEYYVYCLSSNNNELVLLRHKKPNVDTRDSLGAVHAKDVTIANGVWLNVKVVVEGDTFQLWINDKLQREDKDKTYLSGQIGVWGSRADASFDDVMVTGKDIAGAGSVAVQPAGKLTSTWGRVKSIYR